MKMENKENTVRVDKRPSSIYSMVVFLLVFTAVYVFYPQISMWIPFLGENRQIETDYKTVGVADMLDAPVIVVAKCTEKGDTQCVAGGGSVNVYKTVSFETKDAIVGNAKSEFTLTEQGGSALVDNGGARKKKYNITYKNAAEFKTGKTYLLFLTPSGEILNGKSGAIEENDDGNFTDLTGKTYSVDEVKALLDGGEQQ